MHYCTLHIISFKSLKLPKLLKTLFFLLCIAHAAIIEREHYPTVGSPGLRSLSVKLQWSSLRSKRQIQKRDEMQGGGRKQPRNNSVALRQSLGSASKAPHNSTFRALLELYEWIKIFQGICKETTCKTTNLNDFQFHNRTVSSDTWLPVQSDLTLQSYELWSTRSSIHGIFQARRLEWVASFFSRGSSQPRDWTQVSHIAGGFFTSWAEAQNIV